jgi:hypothetical protein
MCVHITRRCQPLAVAIAVLAMACSPRGSAPASPATAAGGLHPPHAVGTGEDISASTELAAIHPTHGKVSDARLETRPEEPPPVYPFNEPLSGPGLPREAPAVRNANLSPAQCRAETRRRKLPVRAVGGDARGIAVPLRLDGPLRGVRFVAPGRRSPYGLLDCRLALTLDDLAEVLAAHGVVEVRVDNMYRPRAHLPGSRKRSQHAYGLAADITQMKLADGRTLVVERDFQGARGEPVCGPESRLVQPTPEAIALRNVLCAAAGQGLFHHILTPGYDEAHRDHLHLDIKRDEKRRSVH